MLWEALQKKQEMLEADILRRIRSARVLLDSIERSVKQRHSLNPLGEMQGEFDKLDCRLAGLAEVRALIDAEINRQAEADTE